MKSKANPYVIKKENMFVLLSVPTRMSIFNCALTSFTSYIWSCRDLHSEALILWTYKTEQPKPLFLFFYYLFISCLIKRWIIYLHLPEYLAVVKIFLSNSFFFFFFQGWQFFLLLGGGNGIRREPYLICCSIKSIL